MFQSRKRGRYDDGRPVYLDKQTQPAAQQGTVTVNAFVDINIARRRQNYIERSRHVTEMFLPPPNDRNAWSIQLHDLLFRSAEKTSFNTYGNEIQNISEQLVWSSWCQKGDFEVPIFAGVAFTENIVSDGITPDYNSQAQVAMCIEGTCTLRNGPKPISPGSLVQWIEPLYMEDNHPDAKTHGRSLVVQRGVGSGSLKAMIGPVDMSYDPHNGSIPTRLHELLMKPQLPVSEAEPIQRLALLAAAVTEDVVSHLAFPDTPNPEATAMYDNFSSGQGLSKLGRYKAFAAASICQEIINYQRTRIIGKALTGAAPFQEVEVLLKTSL